MASREAPRNAAADLLDVPKALARAAWGRRGARAAPLDAAQDLLDVPKASMRAAWDPQDAPAALQGAPKVRADAAAVTARNWTAAVCLCTSGKCRNLCDSTVPVFIPS